MRAPLPLVLALLAAALGGCAPFDEGERIAEDVRARAERVRDRADEVRERIERIRADARRVGDEVAARVRQALEDLEKVVPEAGPQTRAPTTAGRVETGAIDAFLTDVLRRVDAYWTRTFAAAGLDEPRVRYAWVPRGRVARSACGEPADDRAAFYCPADDTIYVGQVLAAGVFRGIEQGFPGEASGHGRAVGDFGVAYLVAHEYAHNLQQELGFLSARRGDAVKPFELQADCMAGLWGNSVYREGLLKEGDVEEALGTALAVGDFEFGNPGHHGTPQERRDAWLLGFDSGEPEVCRHFVRA